MIFFTPLVIILFAFCLWFYDPNFFKKLFGFEQLLEHAQFFAYFSSGLIGICSFSALNARNDNHKYKFLFFLFTAGCFLIALEEISWGQHIFKWETPELFSKINTQNETNLHNIAAINTHLLFILVGLFGGGSWILKQYFASRLIDFLCPDVQLSSFFLPVFLFYFYFDYINPLGFFIIPNYQELFEFILSLGFLLVSLSNLQKIKNCGNNCPEPSLKFGES